MKRTTPIRWLVGLTTVLSIVACSKSPLALPEERPTLRCTQVIGYSQVQQWYSSDGAFEAQVDETTWQLLWNGGGGVDLWQDPNYVGWSKPITSACAEGSTAPERVVLSISGPYGTDEAAWAQAIQATIRTIQSQLPTAEQIVLMPVVGGPTHQTCQMSGQDVRASWQHAHIDAAISTVIGGDIVAGMSPEVRTCADYEDQVGHLTQDAAGALGGLIGLYYAGGTT